MFTKSLIVLAAAGTAMAQLMIQTPASLIQCQPVLLSWSGGKGPYFLAAIPGGQSSAAALKDFGQQSGTSLTWNVDIAAGTSVSLKVTDSTGVINYNQAVTVQPGSSAECLTAAGSSSTSGMASSAVTSAAGTATMMASSSAAAAAGGIAAASAGSSVSMSASSAMMSASSAASSARSSVSAVGASAASSVSGSSTRASTSASGSAASASSSSSAAFPALDISSGILAVAVSAMGLVWI